MRRIFTSTAPTVVTGIAGISVLVSFLVISLSGLFPDLAKLTPSLSLLRLILINIAVIIAGVAVVMGFGHLLYVHVLRLRHRRNAFYSAWLLIAAVVTLGLLIVDRIANPANADRVVTRFIFNDLIVPMQSALGALLAVFLALAAVRMLQHRRGLGAVWFLIAALIVLITQIPLPALGNLGDDLIVVRNFFDAATTGGLRGLLLGVALGTVATAFRVLFFIDRPQSE